MLLRSTSPRSLSRLCPCQAPTGYLAGQLQGGLGPEIGEAASFCFTPSQLTPFLQSHPIPAYPSYPRLLPPILPHPNPPHLTTVHGVRAPCWGDAGGTARHPYPQPPWVQVLTEQMSSVRAGEQAGTTECLAPGSPFPQSWAPVSSSGSPASLCREPDGLAQPARTTPGCVRAWGRGGTQSLPSPPGLAGGQVVGVGLGGSTGGGIFKGPHCGHCQPPDPRRLHREPQCPGAPRAPFTGAVPARTGTGPSPWGGGRVSFYSRSGQLCKGGSAHTGLVTQRTRETSAERRRKKDDSLLLDHDCDVSPRAANKLHRVIVTATTS